MELSTGLFEIADSLGIGESFCPVRAMLGAFITQAHFPIPDLLTCSVGATCDDFSAIAQRLNGLGHPILWWEMPARRRPDPGEPAIVLPGGFRAPLEQVEFVAGELQRIKAALESLAGTTLSDDALAEGIRVANAARQRLAELRRLAYTAPTCPMPALEMQIAEMLAIHFCSDREESIRVFDDLLDEVRRRVGADVGHGSPEAVRVFWVNPVADLRAMNLLEECGARICGTDYMFCHALDEIPEDIAPIEALARMALADPMVGPVSDRAARICADIQRFGAEAVVVSRIPGASHCAFEGTIIRDTVQSALGLPVAEIEVPPISDALRSTLRTRIEALVEAVLRRRERPRTYVEGAGKNNKCAEP
jgi:benzoyl-CoA reductase/2-hydroxyglutaryl-CoA dehydratase subunit BcrC/BadD/HgdB